MNNKKQKQSTNIPQNKAQSFQITQFKDIKKLRMSFNQQLPSTAQESIRMSDATIQNSNFSQNEANAIEQYKMLRKLYEELKAAY